MARRSPNYPSMSFTQAITLAKKIYDEAMLHKTDKASVARIIGYSGLNGASLRALGALNAYGLLDGSAEDCGLTLDAQDILVEPPTSQEHKEAVKRCAFAPQIYQQIKARYEGRWPGNEVLKAFLLKSSFSAEAVSQIIENYKDTFEYVEYIDNYGKYGDNQSTNALVTLTPREEKMNHAPSQPQIQQDRPLAALSLQSALGPSLEGKELFSYEFEPSGSIRLMIYGDVDTNDALDILEDLVAMKKKELARKKKVSVKDEGPRSFEDDS